ncbi:MAG TPA: hypothetical protein VFJ98_07900 [Mycobacteriales bacterium]|jgi:hypothetical protein|nr:hypothetical protein [Mycobacteriales bacterium]
MTSRYDDEAARALRVLEEALAKTVEELQSARLRLKVISRERESGRSWREITETEGRPLLVETISSALERLASAGSGFRRAEAKALHDEGLSMERVATLFGVTRQRVSALLRDRGNHGASSGGSGGEKEPDDLSQVANDFPSERQPQESVARS